MSVLWVGAAAGVRLYVEEETTAWATVYRVDWSINGAGSVFSLLRDGHLRVLGTSESLSQWITEGFNAPMTRSAATGATDWQTMSYETVEVEVTINPDTGANVRAGEIELVLSEPLDRQLIFRDPYVLDGEPHRMSFVNIPCNVGTIAVGGISIDGQPRRWIDDQGRLRSTAQAAVAEVWST